MQEKNSIQVLSQEEISDKLQKMQTRVLYMSDTIEDFMNYYRPNKSIVVFKLVDALNKALEIVNFSDSNRTIKLNIQADEKVCVEGLANDFVQVIVSILSNIYDLLTERSLESINIDIKLTQDSQNAILTINDNAGGIDEKNLSKIFNPYFTTKHQSMGTGLGLYIAKMIIENTMHGTLDVQNSKDGALFTIRTPHAK
jgi:signal transduction histidine kinase